MTAVRYVRVSWWYFAFDTCPVSKAQRCVWGHHIMVGAGTRPLKQDYCIASDSHFVGEEPSQSASAVGASRNCSPTCHSLYLFMMSESRISNFSTLKTGLILMCWICIILLFTHILRILLLLCRDPQCKPSGLFVSTHWSTTCSRAADLKSAVRLWHSCFQHTLKTLLHHQFPKLY